MDDRLDEFHSHEVLHTLHVVRNLISSELMDHPFTLAHPTVKAAIERALNSLGIAYQLTGAIEFEASAAATPASTTGTTDAPHTDHPSRHWDRTCPACVAEGTTGSAQLRSDEETVRAAIEAAQLTPNRDMDAYEALARLVTRASASGAVGETAVQPDNREELRRQCLEMAAQGAPGLIRAIKHYRNVRGSSLLEAKRAVESMVAAQLAGLPGTSNGQEN